MDYNRFYKELFQPIEERIGHVDAASITAIIGGMAGVDQREPPARPAGGCAPLRPQPPRRDSKDVYYGLITISCAALAELARRGVFGDWSKIDFNVFEVGDGIEVVKQRDQQIRRLIADDA